MSQATRPELYMSYGTRGSRVLWACLEASIDIDIRLVTLNKGPYLRKLEFDRASIGELT
jgi:hypothetical protein